jgi:hypothetical protein
MNSVDPEKVSMLASMGFDVDQAQRALVLCDGNVDLAVDRILSGTVFSDPTFTGTDGGSGIHSDNDRHTNNSDATGTVAGRVSFVNSNMSQYSLPNGRSACTCIAIQAASTILPILNEMETSMHNHGTPTRSPKDTLASIALPNLLHSGVQLYNDLENVMSMSSVEHLSPEEVLNSTKSLRDHDIALKPCGEGVRQGVLSNNMNESSNPPLGFKEIINSCRMRTTFPAAAAAGKAHDDVRENEWLALVITKTPETVCIFLPPTTRTHNESHMQEENAYILVDSHPRPVLSAEGSYFAFHSSLDDLVSTLNQIFPATDLGPDVGEIMAAMYNSFDVYPLQASGNIPSAHKPLPPEAKRPYESTIE